MSKHPAFSEISVCVFDAYGTLLDLSDIVDRARPDLGDTADVLCALWRRKQLEYSWLRTLMGRHTDFWHVTGEALDHAMAALKVRDPSLRARMMEAYLSPRPYPEVLQMLARLKQAGYRTGVLSNGSPSMLVGGLNACDLTRALDAVLSVELAGVFKPHPSVYQLAVDHFGVEPRRICFVSGNGWDVAGASAFGFRVAWINRIRAARDVLPAGPHAEIANLSELPALLGA